MTQKVSSGWKSAFMLIAVAAVFLLVWAGFAQHAATQRKDELTALQGQYAQAIKVVRQQQLEAVSADKATVSAAQAKAKIAKSTETELKKVDNALQKHPEWANEPIPADVLDSMR
ncbi:i-spanin [Caulobacter phage Percy]|uniref:I-spanin n=1 Tax=Caulobacter phage Percy TaxID=1701809 RepID=A0A0M4RDI5_9CAUD|nr:Rz-like spanin [Caulobacter phage Percy]ALF01688.1 i-spanin [Caulobacter phage Percy]